MKSMKKKILSMILMMAVIFSVSLSGLRASAENTNSSSNYDEQIEKAEKAKADAQKRVDELKKDLAALEKDKGNTLKYVEKIDKKMDTVSAAIKKLNKQITEAREELAKLEEQLEIAEKIEQEQYETMKKRIKYMYESGNDGYMELIFSAKSISEFLNRSEYIEKISRFDADLFSKYVQTKEETEVKRSVMESKVDEISGLQDEAVAEKNALKSLKNSKKSEINKLNTAINATDSRARTFAEQVAEAERKVENLLLEKQKEVEKEEQARKALEQSSGQGTGDTYATNTDGLRWPLTVSGRISSYFGSRTSPTAGASTNHQGIDIAVTEGTPIVAAGAGTVVTAAYSASAGNYIMLYHGNSLYTVYMHASRLAVAQGVEVKQGDVIAYVGSTGVSTGSHLHFGVSVNGAYVNPLSYVSQ